LSPVSANRFPYSNLLIYNLFLAWIEPIKSIMRDAILQSGEILRY
jgi:hypothetical protein